jgi:hypothetical protein
MARFSSPALRLYLRSTGFTTFANIIYTVNLLALNIPVNSQVVSVAPSQSHELPDSDVCKFRPVEQGRGPHRTHFFSISSYCTWFAPGIIYVSYHLTTWHRARVKRRHDLSTSIRARICVNAQPPCVSYTLMLSRWLTHPQMDFEMRLMYWIAIIELQ